MSFTSSTQGHQWSLVRLMRSFYKDISALDILNINSRKKCCFQITFQLKRRFEKEYQSEWNRALFTNNNKTDRLPGSTFRKVLEDDSLYRCVCLATFEKSKRLRRILSLLPASDCISDCTKISWNDLITHDKVKRCYQPLTALRIPILIAKSIQGQPGDVELSVSFF